MSMASCAILLNFFEEQWIQNHPQYLLGLPRALFATTFLEIAVYVGSNMDGFPTTKFYTRVETDNF